MDPTQDFPADPQPNWAQLLPREAFHEIILTLRGALPRPESGDPLGARRRDRAAMAAVGSLLPANAAEGRMTRRQTAPNGWSMPPWG